jgi:hypothetical protein
MTAWMRAASDSSMPHHMTVAPHNWQIGGITIRVEADMPITPHTFAQKCAGFLAEGGDDAISIRHHFALPRAEGDPPGVRVYHDPPWAVYRQGRSWLYLGILPFEHIQPVHRLAVFSDDHCQAEIFSPNAAEFRAGNLEALTMLPTDQIVLARVLSDRQACIMHAGGMHLGGSGLLFLGHSSAGKSTVVTQLRSQGTILCDDRMIVRRWLDGWRIHGTWSHGTVPDVSPGPAPLRALLFLEQANENCLVPMERAEVARRLPFLVIKPLVTADWWEKTFDTLEKLVREVPAYRLRFDLSGRVADVLAKL